jgi:hypothetical protein
LRYNPKYCANGSRAICPSLLSRLDTHEADFTVLIEELWLARRLAAILAEARYTLTVRDEEGSASKFSFSWRLYFTNLEYRYPR